MQILEPVSFPLRGAALIEASAGTGKTYTIVNLYLRLLLGHQCQPLNVDQILVVTFTKAATAELKTRIRQKLSAAYEDFYRGSSEDPVVEALIQNSQDRETDCKRLALSIRQMDEAAVFTIHSFCQRTLLEHAFESGTMYEQSLILDESEWLKLATDDYWRTHIVPGDEAFQQSISSIWDSPEALRKELAPLMHRSLLVDDSVSVDTSLNSLQIYCDKVAAVKSWWLSNDIGIRLLSCGLKKNTLLGKPQTYELMAAFCLSKALVPPFKKEGWAMFSPEKLSKALPKGKSLDDLGELDFEQFTILGQQYAETIRQLRVGYSQHALLNVKDNLNRHKTDLHLMSPDDLLVRLEQALSSEQGDVLARAIRSQYPAVLIDEFQDTDPAQFTLFSKVYEPGSEHLDATMIMIGDPKQAIYGFRGADIFTYIEAKRILPPSKHFTLAKNWRSQSALVCAINRLFDESENGFLFEQDIPFVNVDAARQQTALKIAKRKLNSLDFQWYGHEQQGPLSWAIASQGLAEHTAQQITELILQGSLDDRSIRAGDCCVLVRDRDEAALIKQALWARNIASVFLIRKSVFATQTAADLYLLLTAIANPSNERALKAALATDLLSLSASELDEMISDEVRWQALIDECFYWQRTWQQQGILLMLSKVSGYFSLFHNLIKHFDDGLRRVTDLRHLSELLQQQSLLTPSESQLLHWYGEQLNAPDHEQDGQQIRLETDENLVQIVTMHASKGLEFPLVFIPFACRYRPVRSALYHDQQHTLRVDFSALEARLALAEHERLAEDIRLLYVALTRAVFYCSVGIWDPAHPDRRKESVLRDSALGSLLYQTDKSFDIHQCIGRLQSLSGENDIGCNHVLPGDMLIVAPDVESQNTQLSAAALTQPIDTQWQLTSYSAISRHQSLAHSELPGRDEGVVQPALAHQQTSEHPDQFSFVKGAQAGSFLHGVLENIHFDNPENLDDVVEQQGRWYGIEESWFDVVVNWIKRVLETPLEALPQGLKLADLPESKKLVEMEFHLPLNKVTAADFNRVLNTYSGLPQRQYDFDKLNGMLKGYIDLTFEHDGKYFVADYKSNHLGHAFSDYHGDNLERAMSEHDYHLQAILYLVAVHRWLSVTLPDYSYTRHIGGAYYLFLRGMEPQNPQSGIYHLLPDERLITELDNLFAGKSSKETLPADSDGGEAENASADEDGGQMNLW